MATVRHLKAILEAEDRTTPVLGRVGTALKLLGGIAAAVGAYQIGRQLVSGFVASVKAAAEAEKVGTQLRVAILNSGSAVSSVLPGLSAYATALQRSTGYSDEAIKSGQALLISLGRLRGEGLERATKAAVDFASRPGGDLESSFLLIARAAAGSTEALSRYGIKISDTIPVGKRFEEILRQLEQRFGGQAAARLNTYAGQVDLLRENIGEIRETIGGWITQSASLRTAIASINTALQDFNDTLGGIQREGDPLRPLVMSALTVADAFIDIADTSQIVWRGLNSGFNATAAVLVSFGDVLAKHALAPLRVFWQLFTLFPDEGVKADAQKAIDNIDGITASTEEAAVTFAEMAKDARDAAVTTSTAFDAIRRKIEAAKEAVEKLGKTTEKDTDPLAQAREAAEAWGLELTKIPARLEPISIGLGRVGKDLTENEVELNRLRMRWVGWTASLSDSMDPMSMVIEMAEEMSTAMKDAAGSTLSAQQAVDSWVSGTLAADLKKPLAEIESSAATMARTMRGAAVNAALSLGDALVDAAERGTFSFKEFARSVLADFARIITQALITRAIVAAIGGGTGVSWQRNVNVGGAGSVSVPVGASTVAPSISASPGLVMNMQIDARGATPGTATELARVLRNFGEEMESRIAGRVRRGGRYAEAFR